MRTRIAEMTAEELERSCRTYICIGAEKKDLAKTFLRHKYSQVSEDEKGYIRIYDQTSPEQVVSYLYENGVIVNEIKTDKIGLEEYYIDLMSNKGVR